MGRSHTKDVLENFLKDQSFRLVHWLSIPLFQRKTSQESINFGEKESLTWIVPRIRFVRGWNLEGWHIGCRHWGVGNDGRIGNLLKKTQCKGSNISQRKWKIYFSSRRWTNKIFVGGDQELRTSTLIRERPIRVEGERDFLGESEGSPPPSPQDSYPDASEAINDFWSMSGNFIYRHHVEPRVKLYLPREESFPIPLKYIDVSRTTRANLDVMQESRIDDYWNIDGSRDLTDSWTGFTQFTLWNEKPPDGYMWSSQIIYGQNFGRNWEEMPSWVRSKNGQLKHQSSIMLEDYEESISLILRTRSLKKPSRMLEKIETPVAPAMPCKTCEKSKNEETRSKTAFKSTFACILEASESTRMRLEESLPNYHEDHIAGRGDNSLQHYNLVHKVFPMPQAMKIPAAKAAVDKESENWRKFRRGTWRKPKVRNRWSMKQGRRAQKFILPHWWTSVIWRMPIWRRSTKSTKVELYSLAILSKMILDLMQYLRNKDLQHHNWQQQKSWISYPDWQDAQDKQLMQYLFIPRSKWKKLQKLLKIPKSQCPDIWIRLPRHKWPQPWSSMEDPVVLLEQNLYGHLLTGLLWERQFGKILLKYGWEKVSNSECLFVHREKGLFLSVFVDDINLAGKNQNIDPMWKVLNKEVDLGEPTSFLDHVYTKTI